MSYKFDGFHGRALYELNGLPEEVRNGPLLDRLLELLETADVETFVRLPRDAAWRVRDHDADGRRFVDVHRLSRTFEEPGPRRRTPDAHRSRMRRSSRRR